MVYIKLLNRKTGEKFTKTMERKQAKCFLNRVKRGKKLYVVCLTADDFDELYEL